MTARTDRQVAADRGTTDRDAADARAPGTSAQHPTVELAPRSVRVAQAPASAHADEPPLVVDPASAASIAVDPSGLAILVTAGSDGVSAGRRRLFVGPGVPLPDGSGIVRRELVVDGWRIEVDVEPARRAALRDRAQRGHDSAGRGGPTEVHAIIPGRVVSVSVRASDDVVAGQQLLVVEAMKMQNELRAPRDGVVSRVAVAAGQTIEIGDLLLVLE
jgi:biotin carboxyl carrier protein